MKNMYICKPKQSNIPSNSWYTPFYQQALLFLLALLSVAASLPSLLCYEEEEKRKGGKSLSYSARRTPIKMQRGKITTFSNSHFAV